MMGSAVVVYSEAQKMLSFYSLLATFHSQEKTIWTYFVKALVTIILIVTNLLSLFNLILLFKYYESLAKDGEILMSLFTGVCIVYKSSLLVFWYPQFVSIVNDSSSILKLFKITGEKRIIIEQYTRHQKKMTKLMGYLFFTTIGIIILDGLFNPNTLGFYRWQRYYTKPWSTIIQILATYWPSAISNINWTISVLFVSLMTTVSAFFDLLAYDLEKLQEIPSIKMQEILQENIRIHQKIIKVARNLENVFQSIVLFEFFHLAANMCMSIFSVTSSDRLEFANTARCILIAMCVATLFYVVCSPGEHLKRRSLYIRQVLFTGNWYERPLKIQKMYFMFLKQTEGIVLLKHRVIPIQMESFGSSIRAAYGFFSFCNAANMRS